MMQIFNLFNARKINDEKNVFSGFYRNWIFCTIFALIFGAQVLIV
jgi:hypothetical protein